MEKIKIVTVLRSGPDWPADYVYKFKKCIDKNVTIPYEFICLSDIELEIPRIPLNNVGQGFWTKIQLFRPELKLTGPCLYFDLDTVIAGNIDSLILEFKKYNFLMLEDPWIPGSSSSAMMWWQGDYSHLYKEYISMPEAHWSYMYRPKTRYGDQAYIMERIDHKHFQSIIPNPAEIKRFSLKVDREGVKIWQFGTAKLKPWKFLDDPVIINHWL
jgi:hypothetical protein